MAYQHRGLTGSVVGRSALKTGRRPAPKNIQVFQPGSILFKEGEVGRELFIISEGEISITKGRRDEQVELARLGAGSILGEMALLDNQARSATATAVKQTKAVVINEATFNAVSSLLPVWLTSIIRIITSRLRDTNKSIGASILKNRPKGIAHLLYMTAKSIEQAPSGEKLRVDYYDFLSEVQFVTRLKRGDLDQNLEKLVEKSLVRVVPGEGTKFIIVTDIEALNYFVEFQAMKEQNRPVPVIKTGKQGQAVIKALLQFQDPACLNRGELTMIPRMQTEAYLQKLFPGAVSAHLRNLRDNGFIRFKPDAEGKGGGHFIINRSQLTGALASLPWLQLFAAGT